MIVWKLAISPMQATAARTFALDPNMTWNPRNKGSCDSPTFAAPGGIDALVYNVRNEHAISVSNPHKIPFGISRLGSCDSSAANGSCSMRQIEPQRRMAAPWKRPPVPRQPLPRRSNAQRLKSRCGIAPIQNTHNTGNAASAMNTEQNDSATVNIQRHEHRVTHYPPPWFHRSWRPTIAPTYPPIPTTIVAGVRIYSIFSASPVTYPPHGPMAVRANEYVPPVCGSAATSPQSKNTTPRTSPS